MKPPHRRGKDEELSPIVFAVRITPAQAGKSWRLYPALHPARDHPRIGGEKLGRMVVAISVIGSPPRRRGKVFLTDLVRVVVRITPAQAGKSRRCCLPGSPRRDHPRVGGEKYFWCALPSTAAGSPPRGRGKALNFGCLICNLRITPALAGKSTSSGPAAASGRDHPRVGGEKRTISGWSTKYWGSPPRGRGKEGALQSGKHRHGITPAWAGKSLASQPWSPPLWMMVIRPRP